MKRLVALVVALILVLPVSSYAASNNNDSNIDISTSDFSISTESDNGLTDKEKSYLINEVGLTEEEIKLFTLEKLREFITYKGKKISTSSVQTYDLASEGTVAANGLISPMSLSDDIALGAIAIKYAVTDVPNTTKIFLQGNYGWGVVPTFKLTDKYSIGFPSTNLWYYRTSSGSILNFNSRTCSFTNPDHVWNCSTSTTPSDASPGIGVASSHDLLYNSSDYTGFVSLDVYTADTNHGTSNVLFRYGHRTLTGSVTVSAIPAGLAVTPSIATETVDYWCTITW